MHSPSSCLSLMSGITDMQYHAWLECPSPAGTMGVSCLNTWPDQDSRWCCLITENLQVTTLADLNNLLLMGIKWETSQGNSAYSLLCDIRSAAFWAPTGVTGLLSAVSCMRSLMMACLSTDPVGAPGLVSGKSCGN